MHDGVVLKYRAWLPERWNDQHARRALLLFHRGHEHGGRLADTVTGTGLVDQGVACFAWDARGHGHSPGRRGDTGGFGQMTADIDAFVRHIRDHHEVAVEDMVLMGHSVGGVAVLGYVHDYGPPIRGMVLATPALKIKLYVPAAVPAMRLRQRLSPKQRVVKSYVKPTMLTHDAEQAAAYRDDPLISRDIDTDVLLDVHDAGRRLLDDAAAVTTPTLILVAGRDWVVSRSAQDRLFDGLGSPVKRLVHRPGMYHDILHESDRRKVHSEVGRFVLDRFEQQDPRLDLTRGDQHGPMQAEHQRLRRPLAFHAPKRWSFAAQRMALRTLGKLSDGVRIGLASGFDSGASLDYIYRNQPAGRAGPVGKLIDRSYLHAGGWRGIRQRRQHLRQLLAEAMAGVRARGEAPRILDIACGGGRYVLDALADDGDQTPPATAMFRDINAANVDAAAGLADELALTERVSCEVADAFEPSGWPMADPPPNIAVAAGVFELFADNVPVRRALHGMSDTVGPEGWVLVTGQPWHPQLEMIARVLPNREGEPWIMRRRTVAEVNALLAEAGLTPHRHLIDRWGIFTVTLARRRVRSCFTTAN